MEISAYYEKYVYYYGVSQACVCFLKQSVYVVVVAAVVLFFPSSFCYCFSKLVKSNSLCKIILSQTNHICCTFLPNKLTTFSSGLLILVDLLLLFQLHAARQLSDGMQMRGKAPNKYELQRCNVASPPFAR